MHRQTEGKGFAIITHSARVGQNRINTTAYDCTFGEFSAKNTVYSIYAVNPGFWPTLPTLNCKKEPGSKKAATNLENCSIQDHAQNREGEGKDQSEPEIKPTVAQQKFLLWLGTAVHIHFEIVLW